MDLSEEREDLRMTWETAKRKLVRQMKKNDNPETLDRSKTEMRDKWELLKKCQSKYLAQLTDDAEKKKERDEYADLEDEQADIIDAADKTDKTAMAMRDKTEIEAKRADFQNQLGKITVSKVSQQQFLDQLRENEIENWSEKSHCKIVYGIKPEFYENKFIGKDGLFQRASGLDDETMASFEMVVGAGGMEDQLKNFTTTPKKSGNKIGGKFGMYAASRRSDVSNNIDLIDVAYTVYEFEADLMGTGDKMIAWMKDSGVTDNVKSTNDKEAYITRLRLGEITALTENFIVSKALTAFAQSNVINKVNWLEDEDEDTTNQLEVD